MDILHRVRHAVATLVRGTKVGEVYEDQKTYDVVVRGLPKVRTDIEAIRELPIDLPFGVKYGELPVELAVRWIPPGSFVMGSTDGRDDEKPIHKVTITRGFWMGQTEVTQAQYQKVMGANPSVVKGDDIGVHNLSVKDAEEFCQKMSKPAPVDCVCQYSWTTSWELWSGLFAKVAMTS